MNGRILRTVLGAWVLSVPAAALGQAGGEKPKIPDLVYVKMVTNKGEIVLELDQHKAPETVGNFLEYVDGGFYDNTLFHRVMPEFMIQGGGYDVNKKKKEARPPIKNESTNGLLNETGAIAMAFEQRKPESASSQFFINLNNNVMLDARGPRQGNTVFGRVIGGMDTVKTINLVPTENLAAKINLNFANSPVEPVVIQSVRRVPAEEIKDMIAAATQLKTQTPTPGGLHVKLATSMGDIILELDQRRAPVSVANFLSYADEGFYNGTMFHRVIKDFMIQGGGMTPDYAEKPTKPPIRNEWQNGLKNVRGSIAMARTKVPDSATSQFFINVVDNSRLDMPQADGAAYAVFGRVIHGMDVVENIRNTPVKFDARADQSQTAAPITPVIIKGVTRLSPGEVEGFTAAAKPQGGSAAKPPVAPTDQAKADSMQIGQYLVKSKGIDVSKGQKSASGLWHVDVLEGTGATPKPADNVTVHCTGWFPDGNKFYSSYDKQPVKPLQQSAGGFIKGFTEGICGMKVGGKRYLIIPPALGYGPKGFGQVVPPNATLIYEIELLSVN